MIRRRLNRKIALAVLAMTTILGCGDGTQTSGDPVDSGIGRDLSLPDGMTEIDLRTLDVLRPDLAADTVADSRSDINPGMDLTSDTGVDTSDAGPELCWSCTTENPDCLCGCVACHTDKARLQVLAPDEPVEEVSGGGG